MWWLFTNEEGDCTVVELFRRAVAELDLDIQQLISGLMALPDQAAEPMPPPRPARPYVPKNKIRPTDNQGQ